MRLTSACLAIGLTGLCAAFMPAHAGDLSNGAADGIRDYGSGGVPVPVPREYQETYKWYLRGDVGIGVKNAGTISNDGLPLAIDQPGSWTETSILSVGFGKYITPSLRAEFTMDYRPERAIETGTQSSVLVKTTNQIGTVGQVNYTDPVTGTTYSSGANQYVNNRYIGTLNEDIKYQNTTLLMSGFYDFNRDGKVHPYIGAGAGMALHQLNQKGTQVYECKDSTTTTVAFLSTIPNVTSNVQPACNTTALGGLLQTYTYTTSAQMMGWGFAAQASAGVSFDLSPRMHWDNGYRMMWQSGHLSVASANGISTIRLNDQLNHELRTGIRWDIW